MATELDLVCRRDAMPLDMYHLVGSGLASLPAELIDLILSFLTHREDFLNIASTCRYLRAVTNNYVRLEYLKVCSNRQRKKYKKLKKICSFPKMLLKLYERCNPPLPKPQLYVPLDFWFQRRPDLSLPSTHLNYHEVSMKVDYIYLDAEEGRRFAQASHEY